MESAVERGTFWIRVLTLVLLGGFVLPSCMTAYVWGTGGRSHVEQERNDGELLASFEPVGDHVWIFVPSRLLPTDYVPDRRAGLAGLAVVPQSQSAELAATLRAIAAGVGSSPRCGITVADPGEEGELTAKLHFDWVEDARLQESQVGFDLDAQCHFVTTTPDPALHLDGAVRGAVRYRKLPDYDKWVATPFTVAFDVVTLPVQLLIFAAFALAD